MFQGPTTGPCAEAPAPLSPGLAEAGGEYGCGAAGSGQRGRRQTGLGGLGSGLADPWVTEGNDPWARYDNRVNTGLGPIGSYVSVPCPPSSASSAASGCANMGMPMAAPGLSFPEDLLRLCLQFQTKVVAVRFRDRMQTMLQLVGSCLIA